MPRPVGRALLAAPVLLALASQVGRAQAPAAAPAASPPTAARLAARDLGRLRWIVGDWRGVGTAGTTQAPFYERYRLADDSTLIMEGFADSTFGAATGARDGFRWERAPGAGARPRSWQATLLSAAGRQRPYRLDRLR